MCLRLICEEVVKRYQPKLASDGKTVIKTYCNIALAEIAALQGYRGFIDDSGNVRIADEICKILDNDWLRVDGDTAFKLARGGTWCIAASSSHDLRLYGGPKFTQATHGHVATVYPKNQMGHSAGWRKQVPWLANVGANNGIKIASLCFPAEPKYYYLPGGHTSTQGA